MPNQNEILRLVEEGHRAELLLLKGSGYSIDDRVSLSDCGVVLSKAKLVVRDYLFGIDDGIDSMEEELEDWWLGFEGLWIIFTIEFYYKVGK